MQVAKTTRIVHFLVVFTGSVDTKELSILTWPVMSSKKSRLRRRKLCKRRDETNTKISWNELKSNSQLNATTAENFACIYINYSTEFWMSKTHEKGEKHENRLQTFISEHSGESFDRSFRSLISIAIPLKAKGKFSASTPFKAAWYAHTLSPSRSHMKV